MAVDGRRAVGVRDVECAAVPAGRDGNAHHVAVGGSHDGLARHAVGLDVHARMEMPGAYLAEIGRVEPLFQIPQGVDVILRVELLSPHSRSDCRKQKQY